MLAATVIMTFGSFALATWALSQPSATHAAPRPGWFLQVQSQSADVSEQGADKDGRLAACGNDVVKYCIGPKGPRGAACLKQNLDGVSAMCKQTLAALPVRQGGHPIVPRCSHSPLCSNTLGGDKTTLQRVEWKQTGGYKFSYPFVLPVAHGGGVSGVAIDSKDDLWAFQRNAPGQPQLFKFGPDHKLVLTIAENVIGHQYKAHGIDVDAQDNVWICDADGSTVMKISPEGKLLMTIGKRGTRGDWDEAKGQRLLWQPMDIAFGPNGDIYIGEGHADESPNDTDSADPADNIGAARVIHLDQTGRFINQWYGNSWGPGKFESVHGIGVDPKTGNVWLGDRDQYRLIIYTGQGKFIKTLSMKNLTCDVYFDPHGQPWIATGNDGQLIKIDQDGNTLVAVGNGRGTGFGQFMETNFMAMDTHGNLYTGDTTVARVTEMMAPVK
jgi:hypothetical protein